MGWAQAADAQALDTQNLDGLPFELEAADVSFDAAGSKVVALGVRDGVSLTQVLVRGEPGEVRADKITYDMDSGMVLAEGRVSYTDDTGNVLNVQRLELSGDMRAGALQQMRLRVPILGEVLRAMRADVSGTIYQMEDVVYSPCAECPNGGSRPWEIRADQVAYDQSASEVTYRNATMRVYGAPVLYLPWFRHPLGTRQAKSGLLPPMYGKSTVLGDQVTLRGYVYSPDENADYTLATRLMSARGAQFLAERRQVGLESESEIKASFLNDTGVGRARNHLSIVAQQDLDATRRIGINGEMANDDNYLNQFFSRNDPYLASTLYAEDGGAQHYVALAGTFFQDLNASKDPAKTAQVLPRLQMERWWDVWGGQVDLGLDVTSLYRDEGDLSRRVVSSGEFRRPVWLDDGSKLTIGATARLDFYATEGPTRDGFATRALPEVSLLWEKPYLSSDGGHSITPLVMAAFSPRGGNVSSKIPNEDSAAYELDTVNLFEASRFAGLDRVETGPRLVYGLDNRWGTADSTRWRFFAGQSLRKFDDTTLPLSGGAGTKDSDWVGLAEAAPAPWLNLSSRFRLDHSSFAPQRMDSALRLGELKKAYVSVGHSYLNDNTDEFTSRMRLPLTEKLAFEAQSRNDLRNSQVLLAEGGLSWREDCYLVKLMVRRRGFTSGDVQPSTDYSLNVELLSLGDDGS